MRLRSAPAYVREGVIPAVRPALVEPDYCVAVGTSIGRYWTSLLYPLTARGGSVAVVGPFPRRDYGHPDAPGAGPLRLPGVRFSCALPRRTDATTLIAEFPKRRLDRRGWAKRLRLSMTIDDDLAQAGPFYRLPYTIHPSFIANGCEGLFPAQRSTARTTRVLFAGNTDPRAYDTAPWHRRKAQYEIGLNRFEAVNALAEALSDDELFVADWNADDLPRLFDGSCRAKMFMARWNAFRGEQWPRALGACDFFLTLPGVNIPFSHNIVEAMAAGCIPITGYSHWFTPNLVDGQDCLTFSDAASLIAAVRRALAMAPSEVAQMRANATEYYDRHLAPATVPEALDALPDGATVYLINERDEALLGSLRRGTIAFPGP